MYEEETFTIIMHTTFTFNELYFHEVEAARGRRRRALMCENRVCDFISMQFTHEPCLMKLIYQN